MNDHRSNAELDAEVIALDQAREDLGPTPPAYSDEALALRFAERHRHDLRYVASWGRWLAWDGKRWCFDDTLAAFDRARKICREAAAECNQARIASTLASAKTVAAVERLAKADRRLAATVDQWDTDPWLLNTPRGVVDLRTGDSYGHSAARYVTKITAAAPGGDCPTWRKVLDRVTDGNPELQDFLQRMAGYALTGSTREHALFFAHGRGANGKSVFVGTINGILGEYATIAPIETFTASNSDRHPTDLAGLRGARLVTAVETEEGRRWAESKIKALTGGDKIAARFMRQDFFEYVPQFKLIIAGNHKPSLRGVARRLAREDYPAGNLAQLRRLEPDRPGGAPFWFLVAEYAPVAFDHEPTARALAVTVNGMAIAHPFHISADRRSLGTALAEAEVSDARLLRLLRTDRDGLPTELRRLARLMAGKGEAGRFDWAEVFSLVFYPEDESNRRTIAKDYYRRQYNLQHPKGEAA